MARDFLAEILVAKKVQIADAKAKYSERELQKLYEERMASGLDGVGYRGFYEALVPTEEPRIIAEIKRASPSRGDICLELDAESLAKEYEAGGAAALSVLTEPDFFKGTLEDLKKARAACSLPVLRKDFIIEEYQVLEAAAFGADAILLIVRILEEEQLNRLYAYARKLGLDVLVEVYAAEEMKLAQGCGARLVGINNRNLASFETSLDIAKGVAQDADESQILVAASGIWTRADVEENLDVGLSRFLVGESLVRADDAVEFLQELCGR